MISPLESWRAERPPSPAGQRYAPARGGSLLEIDFNVQPFTVAWEITRACALACVHCRASAIPRRDPAELSTQEALRFIEQVVDIGRPILVVTGGDPMMREDVYELLGYGVQRGLRVALAPSATGRVTRRSLEAGTRHRRSHAARQPGRLDSGAA